MLDKNFIQIFEDIDVDYKKLLEGYNQVLKIHPDFHPRHNTIGLQSEPGAENRFYNHLDIKDGCNEFIVDFVDTYFYELWQNFNCERMRITKINPWESSVLNTALTHVNIVITIIACGLGFFAWPEMHWDENKPEYPYMTTLEFGKTYIVNTKPSYFNVNLGIYEFVFLSMTIPKNSKYGDYFSNDR